MFNYSQQSGNNIGAPGDVGVEALVNVTGNAGTQTGSLDGVGYSMTHGDYWQQGFGGLGDPYIAVLENNVTIAFDSLDGWLLSNSATAYEVTVYYSGNPNNGGQAAYIGTPSSVSIGGNTETITVVTDGGGTERWSGLGATHTFSSDTLTITDTATAYQAGISAIRIVAVPEPSSAALLGLGGVSLMLRRRK